GTCAAPGLNIHTLRVRTTEKSRWRPPWGRPHRGQHGPTRDAETAELGDAELTGRPGEAGKGERPRRSFLAAHRQGTPRKPPAIAPKRRTARPIRQRVDTPRTEPVNGVES